MKKIQAALISVFYKDGLEELLQTLHNSGVHFYSTGGTLKFIRDLGYTATSVEDLTQSPEMLGGRVKTLHPKVFGGILYRRKDETDIAQAAAFGLPPIDMVVVNLYPFEETVKNGGSLQECIEKIDIGGVSLIRAAAKNYEDVVIVSHAGQYGMVNEMLIAHNGATTLEFRKQLAAEAYRHTAAYDSSIQSYLVEDPSPERLPFGNAEVLRYGENPHQRGVFYGDLQQVFHQLNGKALSYNNLVDIDAALHLMHDIKKEDLPAFAIIKHTNACGVAYGDSVREAYEKAFACDPVSAFGGILVSSHPIDANAAGLIDTLFFEVLLAPDFSEAALEVLKKKKNRVILKINQYKPASVEYKTLLNGVLAQDKDLKTINAQDLRTVTKKHPDADEISALLFANTLVKHTKSNTIVLAKKDRLLASGTGQTSRVDALQQAIHKAKSFGFDLKGAVMASDAFFPFPDCVQIAYEAGILAVIQPGGSIKDQDSIAFCDSHGMAMVFTGIRHFKH
jgi:phosphoribosylaminoimidazolecarboxamide formyltransferase/IMP cyclohydrolase